MRHFVSVSCKTLVVLFITACPFYASASLLQHVFDENNNQIGTFEFGADSGTTISAVLQADLNIGGVQFSLSELLSAEWIIDPTDWAAIGVFEYESPTFGNVAANGYEIRFNFEDGLLDSSAGLAAASIGCEPGDGTPCAAEAQPFVNGIDATVVAVHQAVPEPHTLALLGLGLAGMGLSRRKGR